MAGLSDLRFPDWSPRRHGSWRAFGAPEWPRPHRHDAAFRRLHLYVYPLAPKFTTDVWRNGTRALMRTMWRSGQEFCLMRYCQVDWDGSENARQFTSEIPVMLRLLQSTTLVTDPQRADAFVVPFPIGTYQTLIRWQPQPRGALEKMKELTAELASLLPFLNKSTAARHIFFQSVDSVFVGLADFATAPFIPSDAIVFHLGDDFHYYGRIKNYMPMKRAVRFNNSITIPYRSFLPSRLNVHTPWEDAPRLKRRRLLVFGALNPKRHWLRTSLITAMNRSRLLAPGRIMVGAMSGFSSLAKVSNFQYNSSFCLCPSGDNPAFTQRLYVSILHGCIPVRIDTFLRYPADPEGVESAYPFPHLIDWSRMVLTISANGGNSGPASREALAKGGFSHLEREFSRLVPKMLDMEESGQVFAMREYMRKVAQLLIFDGHSRSGLLERPDAASAALYELALKLGKPCTRKGHGLPPENKILTRGIC